MKKTILTTVVVSLLLALALAVTASPGASANVGEDHSADPYLEPGEHYYGNGYERSSHSEYRRTHYRWSFWRNTQYRENMPYNWWTRNWFVNHHPNDD